MTRETSAAAAHTHSPGVAPSVSVITPTYNRVDTLPRAINSVLGQDFADLELLVIDDGSTDHTADLIAGLRDPRLRYLRFDTNRGIGAARHEGVANSRAPLVAFLDSDDSWRPGRLASAVAAFARYPQIDFTFTDFEDINYISNSRERGFVNAEAGLRRLRTSRLGDDWWSIDKGAPEGLMRMNFVGTASAVVMRRTVFERAGNFRQDLSGPEDLEMWWRAALLGAHFSYTTQVLVERHKQATSITAQKRMFATRRLRALDACEDTARSVGRFDLLPYVDEARSRTWCDLVEVNARDGDRSTAWTAFRSSLAYRPSLEAIRYLVMALVGPRTTALAQRLRSLRVR